MAVSQKDIAEFLGIDRSTVTKVLNRDPRYSASEKTRDLVFRTAEQLGYDFTAIRRPFKREYGRIQIGAQAEISLHTGDGAVFDAGQATILNLSVGGALLSDIRTGKMVLPLAPFSLRLRILDVAELADLEGECELVRISDRPSHEQPQLGVKFVRVKLRDRRKIREFIEEKLRLEERPGLDKSAGKGAAASAEAAADSAQPN